ncbi:ABC-three component system protein [Mycoplasma feriruminatoris]|uniref:SMEK domain-containing protein n=1 Tax=Mycoplasma feriruminatoris TaxID=1179777 RepID=A0A654I9N9_9MOLU|nr:ABC-three component system protein [Mycoplasma feriruminatoris]UKS53984.1 hypothetical protein D500_00328 [Mycoplasma feriruminatoris]VZK65150.1 hypothetical protein MF5292_00315 [Mycoplasma feriruminatoris]VZR75296.1 hypothetical protein MF5294_00316 [Mycoplasma feriruminatoris]VZR97428.1 hypothetical protein MF5293_00315 [Mycoplasma feriruminatoris]
MQTKNYIDNIIIKLQKIQDEIKALNSANLYDINKIAENVLAEILNIIYDWSLINANSIQNNMSGFDLIDYKNKILIQVSTTFTKEKLQSSLNKEIYKDYQGYNFKFLSLIKNTKNNWNIINPYNLIFDLKNDLIDFEILSNKISFLKLDKLEKLSNLLDKELNDNSLMQYKNFNVSILADIINELSKINLRKTKVSIPEPIVFKIQDKINNNDFKRTKDTINEYWVFSSIITSIYDQFDKQANNKSFAVLQNIRQIYQDQDVQNKYTSDEIYNNCKNELISFIKNSTNLKVLEIESLSLYIDIILVDAFMRCKIFKGMEIV